MDGEYPWERRAGESKKAHAALMDYCEMGLGRSIRKLHDRYVKQPSSNRQAESPPTTSLPTLFTWSARHAWPDRAEAWDRHQRAERARRRDEARRRVEDEGLADADALLDEWKRTLEEARSRAASIALEAGARVDGQPTVLVRVHARSLKQLTDSRLAIDALRRRALGMAERVTQAQADEAWNELVEQVPDLSHLSGEELLELVRALGEDGDLRDFDN